MMKAFHCGKLISHVIRKVFLIWKKRFDCDPVKELGVFVTNMKRGRLHDKLTSLPYHWRVEIGKFINIDELKILFSVLTQAAEKRRHKPVKDLVNKRNDYQASPSELSLSHAILLTYFSFHHLSRFRTILIEDHKEHFRMSGAILCSDLELMPFVCLKNWCEYHVVKRDY